MSAYIFYMELCNSTTQIFEMLCEALGEYSLSQTVVFEWHSHFKACAVLVEDDEHSVTTGNVENI